MPMREDLNHWTPRPQPERRTFEGTYARIEPLDADRHGRELFDASNVADADDKFRYLFEPPPADAASFDAWVRRAAACTDPLFFAVIDRATGKVAGRQALMRIDPANGVVEIGSIYWGPLIARRPAATEALYLFMAYAFDTLGYRRFEWKCHDANAPSKRAALRFGFTPEGVFRQHMVVKGGNRDTAWFSIIDKDWPALKAGYQAWLAPDNFDADGRQRSRLAETLAAAR